MARARNIKPGFFANDELAECTPMARLLFIGLWTIADREGVLEDRPKRIKGQIFPFENCEIEQLIDELADRRFVVRYVAKGHKLLWIPTFSLHQKPHHNEKHGSFPKPCTTKVESACDQGNKHLALNDELGILNDERGIINEELGIPPAAPIVNCLDESLNGKSKKPTGPKLTAEQIDAAVDRAIDLRRKVRVTTPEEAFALCRVAVLELLVLTPAQVNDAADQTRRARPSEPAGYFTGIILQAADERGEPQIREMLTTIRFPKARVREVFEAIP